MQTADRTWNIEYEPFFLISWIQKKINKGVLSMTKDQHTSIKTTIEGILKKFTNSTQTMSFSDRITGRHIFARFTSTT